MCPSRPGGSASMATEKAMAGSTDSPGVLIFPGMRFLGEGVDEYDLPTVFYVVRNPDPGSRAG
jgi:hypothetical protein